MSIVQYGLGLWGCCSSASKAQQQQKSSSREKEKTRWGCSAKRSCLCECKRRSLCYRCRASRRSRGRSVCAAPVRHRRAAPKVGHPAAARVRELRWLGVAVRLEGAAGAGDGGGGGLGLWALPALQEAALAEGVVEEGSARCARCGACDLQAGTRRAGRARPVRSRLPQLFAFVPVRDLCVCLLDRTRARKRTRLPPTTRAQPASRQKRGGPQQQPPAHKPRSPAGWC